MLNTTDGCESGEDVPHGAVNNATVEEEFSLQLTEVVHMVLTRRQLKSKARCIIGKRLT